MSFVVSETNVESVFGLASDFGKYGLVLVPGGCCRLSLLANLSSFGETRSDFGPP